MAKNVDVCKNDSVGILPTLSIEELRDFDTFDLSEMIKSIEYAIRYTEGCSFTFSNFGIEETSEKVKAVVNELKGYLELVKDVYCFKVNEKKREENFLKGVNA